MSQPFEVHTISFIVRLWAEPLQADDKYRWRGQIEHVGGEETAYFEVPTGLLEFVAAHLPSSPHEVNTSVETPAGSFDLDNVAAAQD